MKLKSLSKILIRFSKVAFFVYQGISASSRPTCRYQPTCSQYALQAIERDGFYGLLTSLRRILNCQPFSKRPLYDPLPDKKIHGRSSLAPQP